MHRRGVILLAEDDENDAFIFRMALQMADVVEAIVHVWDGQEAIDYLAAVGAYSDRDNYPFPRLVVTDLKMPRSTGFDVLGWIQNQSAPHRPPVVVLSGSNEDSDKKRALGLGAAGYFKKPAGMGPMSQLARKLKETWLPPLTPLT